MRSHRLAGIVVVSLLAACSQGTTNRGGADEYVNQEAGVSLRVPSGWSKTKPWSGLGKSTFVAAFTPGGDTRLTVAKAPFAGIDCAAAARDALKQATGASMNTTGEFEIAAGGEKALAGQATSAVEDRQGEVRYFCHGHTAVAVEGSSSRSEYPSRRAEILAALDTVGFVGASGTVAVRAPVVAATPKFLTHVVRFKGEMLGAIAEWYTGNVDNWRAIARVNEDLSVPNTPLKIGREIKIPEELVMRRDPMPRPTPAPPRAPKAPKAPKATTPDLKPGPGEAPPATPDKGDGGAEDAPLPPVIGPR